jgi:hypothetical protein
MPTTVDLDVAMTPLTVILSVFICGADWWQPGGRVGPGLRIGSDQAAGPEEGSRDPARLRPTESPKGIGSRQGRGVDSM